MELTLRGGDEKISVTRFPHFSLLLLASPSSPRWPHYCSRAAISSAEGPQHSVLTQRRQSHAPNASPGFRRRRSQDHEAFLVSCHALQTSRPCCVACTLNNLLLLLSMRAASAASSQRYTEHSTEACSSQDRVAFIVSCPALQTTRPRGLACTVNSLLLLLSMRAAPAARPQRRRPAKLSAVTNAPAETI